MAPRHHERSSSSKIATNALLALFALSSNHITADARTCTSAPKTLTSQCSGLCLRYHPCVVVDAALDTGSDCDGPLSGASYCTLAVSAQSPCHYDCFSIDKSNDQNFSVFSFFVPFGTWRSKQDREFSANDPAWIAQVSALSAITLNNSVAWKNNDKLQKIDFLQLPDTCLSMYVDLVSLYAWELLEILLVS